MTEQSTLYKEKYGHGYNIHKPDFTRCCEEVTSYETNWPRHHQCARKRGFGPDKAYCKQHDPEVAKAREAAVTQRQNEAWNKRRYEFSGKRFFDTLQQIADGHNDARGLAQEVINKFKEGEAK